MSVVASPWTFWWTPLTSYVPSVRSPTFMVFEVVINHVFVKLSVPSFRISPARTAMGTNANTIVGSKNRRDIVSSFCGAKTSASLYPVGTFRGSRCDGDHTPRPSDSPDCRARWLFAFDGRSGKGKA